jgi:hypothetical protein
LPNANVDAKALPWILATVSRLSILLSPTILWASLLNCSSPWQSLPSFLECLFFFLFSADLSALALEVDGTGRISRFIKAKCSWYREHNTESEQALAFWSLVLIDWWINYGVSLSSI